MEELSLSNQTINRLRKLTKRTWPKHHLDYSACWCSYNHILMSWSTSRANKLWLLTRFHDWVRQNARKYPDLKSIYMRWWLWATCAWQSWKMPQKQTQIYNSSRRLCSRDGLPISRPYLLRYGHIGLYGTTCTSMMVLSWWASGSSYQRRRDTSCPKSTQPTRERQNVNYEPNQLCGGPEYMPTSTKLSQPVQHARQPRTPNPRSPSSYPRFRPDHGIPWVPTYSMSTANGTCC